MSTIKSFSVGNGDMYYIRHGSSNFTIIDSCLSDEDRSRIIDELKEARNGKQIVRFISTHPDEDHIHGLDSLDDEMGILNFYCAENAATKVEETPAFRRYKRLRDGDNAFYLSRGCRRRWMNENGPDESGVYHGSAGIEVLWPDTANELYRGELVKAANGEAFNNTSCILRYSVKEGASAIWMGDLETEFMEAIQYDLELPETTLLFAPHHGRKSGRIPPKWIREMKPDIIIMGEANSQDSDYASYSDYNKIRQNSAGDITFECLGNKIRCYSSNPGYTALFLDTEPDCVIESTYLGTLFL